MTAANYPTHPGDWLTVGRAAFENSLPVELLDEAIQAGDVPVSVACGARVVRRPDVQAWALMLNAQARERAQCDD